MDEIAAHTAIKNRSFPVGQLILLMILIALAGVLAAVGPARRGWMCAGGVGV